jgi:hypothetical protein
VGRGGTVRGSGSYSLVQRWISGEWRKLFVFPFSTRHGRQSEDRRGVAQLARLPSSFPITPACIAAPIVNTIEFVRVFLKKV